MSKTINFIGVSMAAAAVYFGMPEAPKTTAKLAAEAAGDRAVGVTQIQPVAAVVTNTSAPAEFVPVWVSPRFAQGAPVQLAYSYSDAPTPNMSLRDVHFARAVFNAKEKMRSLPGQTLAQVTEPGASIPEISRPRLRVTGKVVNARSAPTTDSQIIAKLRRGTDLLDTGARDGAWVQVLNPETDKTIWMHGKFLTLAEG